MLRYRPSQLTDFVCIIAGWITQSGISRKNDASWLTQQIVWSQQADGKNLASLYSIQLAIIHTIIVAVF